VGLTGFPNSPGLPGRDRTGVGSEMELPFAGLHELCAPILDGLDSLPEPLTATRTYDLEPEVGRCSTGSDRMRYASSGWFVAVAGRPVRVRRGSAWAEARGVAAISAQRAREALAVGLTGWPV
jgi:hypothetical protein